MRGTSFLPLGGRVAVGSTFAVASALVFATLASAQSAEVQYGGPDDPTGAAAGVSCTAINSDDGLLNAGDSITYPADVSIAPGASVVLDDEDGSVGTLVDGENAEISENGAGDIEIAVTGDPINVSGGNGVLNDTVCNSIVASTGISADGEGSGMNGDDPASSGEEDGSSDASSGTVSSDASSSSDDSTSEAVASEVASSSDPSSTAPASEDGSSSAEDGSSSAEDGSSSAEDGSSSAEEGGVSVLPDTGGAMTALYLAVLLVATGGLGLLRYRAIRR